MQPGRYLFTLSVTDAANHTTTQQAGIIVDQQAPVAKVLLPPKAPVHQPLPSKLTLQLSAKDYPEGAASKVDYMEVMVLQVGA